MAAHSGPQDGPRPSLDSVGGTPGCPFFQEIRHSSPDPRRLPGLPRSKAGMIGGFGAAVCSREPTMKTGLTMLARISLMGILLAVQASPTAQAADAWQDSFSRNEFQSGGATLRYRLCAAAEPTSGTKPPLVLFLHGAGERETTMRPSSNTESSSFIAGRRRTLGRARAAMSGGPEVGRGRLGDASGSATFPSEPSEPLRLAIAVMDGLIAAGRVDPDRLYVTGLSMGGYGTWYAAGMPGSRFAAAAPICGGGDPAWAKRFGLPLWAFHGDDDRAVPVGRSREMIAAVRAAGGEPKYTEYPAVGHDSWTRTYADDAFHQWLFVMPADALSPAGPPARPVGRPYDTLPASQLLPGGVGGVHYTLNFDFRTRRVRRSLGTKCLAEAICRRDTLFQWLVTEGEWVPERGEERRHAGHAAAPVRGRVTPYGRGTPGFELPVLIHSSKGHNHDSET